MSFPLGKAIPLLLFISLVTGLFVVARPAAPPRADLILWVFAESHQKTYTQATPDAPSLTSAFKNRTGQTVDVQLLDERALNIRLVSIQMSGLTGPTTPDLVEIEIGRVGKYFRPPSRDVGFVPLNAYLQRSGWLSRILPSRLAPYTKDGLIFGLPHDVHPVALAYRHDLFLQAGIDLQALSTDPQHPLTWTQFHQLAQRFEAYWQAHGQPHRHAIELHTSTPEDLVIMLLQRGINLVDSDDKVGFTDPRVPQTVAFFAKMVAGNDAVAGQSSGGEGVIAQDLNAGNLCAFLTPDWRLRLLKDYSATGKQSLEGKMRLIPLPVFQTGEARTASWGGTMLAIPKSAPHPDQAFALMEHLYLSSAGLDARLRETSIIPPIVSQWEDPRFNRTDPFFGNQTVDRLYIELARELPPRYVTPATAAAASELLWVLSKAIADVNAHHVDTLESDCAAWLAQAAADLNWRIAWGKFE